MSRWLSAGAWMLLTLALGAGCTHAPEHPVDTPPPLTLTTSAPSPSPSPTLTPTPTDTPIPTNTPTPTHTPTPTPFPPDPAWTTLLPGVERRDMNVVEPRTTTTITLNMVRLDPNLIDLRVHFQPGRANTLPGWWYETGALVVVNGGFFTGDFDSQGRTFVEGVEYGQWMGYEDRSSLAGFFTVREGRVAIMPVGREVEPPGTHDFDYATESYPMLLLPGAVPAYTEEETGRVTRRTVAALDEGGRVIFLVIRDPGASLSGLSRLLADLDELHLDVALALDGGRSSGLEVCAGPEHSRWEPVSFLPIVIAAYPREQAEE